MMTAIRTTALPAAIGAVLVYAAVGPGVGVLFDRPLAALGAGLIGLGVTLSALRKARAEA